MTGKYIFNTKREEQVLEICDPSYEFLEVFFTSFYLIRKEREEERFGAFVASRYLFYLLKNTRMAAEPLINSLYGTCKTVCN